MHLNRRVRKEAWLTWYASSRPTGISLCSNRTQSISGAFQLRNDLTRSADNLSNSRYTGKDRSNERKRHVLDTEISTGDNVPSVHNLPPVVIDLSGSSQPKRPKFGSQSSYENSSDVIFDARRSESYTVTRPQQSQGRSQGTRSKGLSNSALSLGTSRSSVNAEVKEFRSVEQTVKIGEKPASKRRQRKIGKHPQSEYSSAANGMPTSPLSPESDLTQTTLQHKQEKANYHQYKGTARNPPLSTGHARPTSQFREQRENGGQSHHLNNALRSQTPHIVHDPRDSSNSKGQRRLNESSSLVNAFIDSSGKRRGDCRSVDTSSLSSDELASTNAVGENAMGLSLSMHSRPNTPGRSSSSQKANFSSSDAIGLEPSNIPASEFTNSRDARPAKRILSQQTTYPGENEAPWSIDLSCVYVPGKDPIKSPNLGLVFDNVTEVYQIRKMGTVLAEMDPSLQIRPQKLMKALWAINSPKVRFEFSKTGNHDNVLHIELGSDKDVWDLLKELRKKNNISPDVCDRCVMSVLYPQLETADLTQLI